MNRISLGFTACVDGGVLYQRCQSNFDSLVYRRSDGGEKTRINHSGLIQFAKMRPSQAFKLSTPRNHREHVANVIFESQHFAMYFLSLPPFFTIFASFITSHGLLFPPICTLCPSRLLMLCSSAFLAVALFGLRLMLAF
ncbi:unnamed protein product [Protopolystoma xenopodis]|uniref:Transmembrane protein n=1 Tax=Protopolystoma xenopodis TaxID=117903 RepID=A0A3S4ZPW0_9PLAT|nr:unnamed protein product [Protopolystoma xenopodis]